MPDTTDETTGESGRRQVNIRVLETEVERWDEAVESSPDYKNRTHLITKAVDEELDSESDQGTVSVDGDEVADAVATELGYRLDNVVEAVNELADRITRLEESVNSDRIEYDLEQAVIDALPEEPDNVVQADAASSWAMTADEVHDELQSRGIDINEPRVRDTCIRLSDTLGFVRRQDGRDSVPDQRDTVFWVVE